MNEHETKMPEAQSPQANSFSIPMAIVVAGILIAGAIFIGLRGSNSPNTAVGNIPQPQQPTSQAADISKVKVAGHPFVGSPNAPITIAYWYDYQCPFCKKSEKEAMPQLISDYIKTGKVKLVYKDFQFLGEDSQTAGLAEHAVWEIAPDKFVEWHQAMYDKQDKENSGWGKKEDILALTKSLGIDSDKVSQLMISKATEYQQGMDNDKTEGSAFGVSGTPSFIIGKQLLVGAQPYSAIKQLIDLAIQSK